jgi:RNA polymerase sigma factor (sigma-70 family)
VSVPSPTASARRRRRDDGLPGFEEYLAESGYALFRLAVVLSADRGAGEDLYQRTLDRLARHWGTLGTPSAWARRVMHNLAVDGHRARRARLTEVPSTDAAEPADVSSSDPLEAAELRPLLLAALGDLSDAQRLVVGLRYLEDRSEADVAEMLDLPVGTVKSTASRAVGRLRGHPALAGIFSPEEAAG